MQYLGRNENGPFFEINGIIWLSCKFAGEEEVSPFPIIKPEYMVPLFIYDEVERKGWKYADKKTEKPSREEWKKVHAQYEEVMKKKGFFEAMNNIEP